MCIAAKYSTRLYSVAKYILATLLVLLVCCTLLWNLYKPARVFWPSLVGLQCVGKTICVEEQADLEKAQALYTHSAYFVQNAVAQFDHPPRIIFCATQNCFEDFGFNKASGQSIGTIAIVIGPRGWSAHIVAHEMIHHIQNEKLGSLTFVTRPMWFIEGMAYGLSNDPRPVLAEPWESYRRQFNTWSQSLNGANIWEAAKNL